MDDDVVLRIADLSSLANLAGADLSGVYLTNADLSDPRAAPLTGGQDLRPARLDGSIDYRRSKRAQRKHRITTYP